MSKTARVSQDGRAHERFERRLRVRFEHNGVLREGVTRNLSVGGMFIVLPGNFPAIGTELKVRLRLPALKDDTELTVMVRWTHADGIGVQFGQLRAREAWALNKLIAEPKPGS